MAQHVKETYLYIKVPTSGPRESTSGQKSKMRSQIQNTSLQDERASNLIVTPRFIVEPMEDMYISQCLRFWCSQWPTLDDFHSPIVIWCIHNYLASNVKMDHIIEPNGSSFQGNRFHYADSQLVQQY